jgi:hypothetical protein|tara:strand:+ start:1002 stop:1484 length:483 start_codon:yes stop_codon:yes gene_type:complete
MALVGARFPAEEEPIDRSTRRFRLPYLIWFRNLRTDLDEVPTKVRDGVVDLVGQSASIGTTAIPTATLATGLYRVGWTAKLTTAATTSSSLTVTLTWTRGVTVTFAGAAITGNTTATFQSEIKQIKIDASSPVSYATTYVSVGATPMVYELAVVLERMQT